MLHQYLPGRARIGMCVGLVLALSATFVSTFINHWVLAGIPLQHPPQLSQIPFGILAGVVVGYLAARPDSTVLGIVVSAAVVTVFLGLRTVVAQSFAATQILGQLLLLLPSFALTCLLTLALRVFTNWYTSNFYHPHASQRMAVLGIWVGLLLLGVLLGSFGRLSAEEEQAVRKVEQYLQSARPPSAPYTLAWEAQDQASEAGATTAVVVWVQFQTGQQMRCLAGRNQPVPVCSAVE